MGIIDEPCFVTEGNSLVFLANNFIIFYIYQYLPVQGLSIASTPPFTLISYVVYPLTITQWAKESVWRKESLE